MVYLIHFHEPYHHAQHYMGYTNDLDCRLRAHRNGNGARLMEVITDAGIAWTLARIWPDGDRALERLLKKQHHGPRLCPICQYRSMHDHADRRIQL